MYWATTTMVRDAVSYVLVALQRRGALVYDIVQHRVDAGVRHACWCVHILSGWVQRKAVEHEMAMKHRYLSCGGGGGGWGACAASRC